MSDSTNATMYITSGTSSVPITTCNTTTCWYPQPQYQSEATKGKTMDLVNIGFGCVLLAIAAAIIAAIVFVWWQETTSRCDRKRAEKRERKAEAAKATLAPASSRQR